MDLRALTKYLSVPTLTEAVACHIKVQKCDDVVQLISHTTVIWSTLIKCPYIVIGRLGAVKNH